MAKITADVETTSQESTPVDSKLLNDVLKRLESLEKENAELKNKQNPMKKAKDKYEGPRTYSYKLWGEVPVLSFKPYKKDESKDWHYKNPMGQFVSNHYLELQLANGKNVSVEVTEFGLHHGKSEKVEAKVISDGTNPTAYVFDVDGYGEITVLPSCIN